jgi:hypothetical protein
MRRLPNHVAEGRDRSLTDCYERPLESSLVGNRHYYQASAMEGVLRFDYKTSR